MATLLSGFAMGGAIAFVSGLVTLATAAMIVITLNLSVSKRWIVTMAGGAAGLLPFTGIIRSPIGLGGRLSLSDLLFFSLFVITAVAYGTIGAYAATREIPRQGLATTTEKPARQFGMRQIMVGTFWVAIFTGICTAFQVQLKELAISGFCLAIGWSAAFAVIRMWSRLKPWLTPKKEARASQPFTQRQQPGNE